MTEVSVENDMVLAEEPSTLPNPISQEPSGPLEPVSEPPKQRRPRLIITQMVLENFKSYGGRQVIGPFHRSFSAIVGPNGSGKSNVIDALLFIFGYRANKIRQGKLSELIHNSKNSGSLSSCSVSVHFKETIESEDGQTFDDIQGSELVVTRTASKNNQSKYLLNGISSSYSEVTNLLRSKGVDLDHKRFLILQGEVENISQMKAMGQNESEVGLLEYLEDIIGTSTYKEQIENARARVDELNGVRSERLQRAKIVEKEKNNLEEKKNEAVEFIRTENALTRKKATLYQKRLQESQAKVDRAKAKFEKVSNDLNDEKKRHAAFRNEAKTLEETHELTTKECDLLGKKAKEVTSELAKFEREEVQLQVNRKHIKGKLKKITDANDKNTHSVNQLKNTLNTLEHDIDSGQKEVLDLQKRLGEEKAILEEISEGLRGKADKFTAAIEEKQKDLAPWKEKINTHQARLDIAQTELNLLNEKLAASGKHFEQAMNDLHRLRELRVEKAQYAESKVEELAGLNEELESIDKSIQKFEGKFQVLKEALAEARRKEEEAKTSLSASENHGKVLKAILQQRDLGRINGIYGRLGSLGTISSKYDVAISSSCGGLDNIVVQSVKAGQECVEFLRKNNVGRARFVILDTLRKYNMDPIRTPENAPRLFDLIKPSDPKFLPAFYHAIGDTLVARDMEQARRIAYGKRRYRVVTLDGSVLETSGTMSGGGNRVARGAMSAKPVKSDVTSEGLAKLTAAREAAEVEYSEHHNKLRSVEMKRKGLQEKYDELESLLPKLELELKSVDDQVQVAKKRARALKEQQETPDESMLVQKSKIDEKISAEQANIAELQEQCATIEVGIKELQEKIMQAGGIRLRAQKSKVDGLQDRISTVNGEITQWEGSQSKFRKELARLERSGVGRESQVTELEQQLESVTKEIESKSLVALEVKQRCDQARVLLETKREELDKIKEELDVKMEEFNEMRTKEAALKRKFDDAERALAESNRGTNYWRSEIDRLVLHPLDLEGLDESDDTADNEDKIRDDNSTEDMDVDDDSGNQQESSTSNAHSLPNLTAEELSNIDASSLERQIEQAEARLQRTRPNLSVLTEYIRRSKEYKKRMADLDDITNKRDQAQKELDDLRTRRLEEFMTGFNIISYKLKEMYQMITLGGNAELELVDSLDPFSEGIVFSVMPPKKSWKNISNLSGGEKTLSSLALVFALHQYKPTPLYVMDEIDAALDFRNVSIVANYIKERTRDAQFVIISLRNNMFELADRLVGIYKTDNRTKSIALDTTTTTSILSEPTAPIGSDST